MMPVSSRGKSLSLDLYLHGLRVFELHPKETTFEIAKKLRTKRQSGDRMAVAKSTCSPKANIMKTIGFSFGLDENRDAFGETDLTMGDYTVTLTSVELLQIIEGLESIGIHIVSGGKG